MSFIPTNPNPCGSYVGDCVVRALSIALGQSWQETYVELSIQGLALCDMPSANKVWGELLKSYGFHRHIIPDTCPQCYTIKDFAGEHFKGIYVVCTGTHVCTIIDGNVYDSWNSLDEQPIFYWSKDEED